MATTLTLTPPAVSRSRARSLSLLTVLFALLIGTVNFGTWSLLDYREKAVVEFVSAELKSTVILKSRAFDYWLDEKRRDTQGQRRPGFVAVVERWLAGRLAGNGTTLNAEFDALHLLSREMYAISLIDETGYLRYQFPEAQRIEVSTEAVKMALHNGVPVFHPVYDANAGSPNVLRIDLYAPLGGLDRRNRSLSGVVIYHLDPNAYLFPIMEFSSTPFRSARTRILFGDEPVSAPYPDGRQLSYEQGIDGVPWRLVSSVDRAEIREALKSGQDGIVAGSVLLQFSLLLLFWFAQRTSLAERHLRDEAAARQVLLNSLEEQAYNLSERAKETRCLYEISGLLGEEGRAWPEVLAGVLAAMPGALRFPELAGAGIALDAFDLRKNYPDEVAHRVEAPIMINEKQRGVVCFCYAEALAASVLPAFIPEELALVNELALRLGFAASHRETTQALAENERLFRTMVSFSGNMEYWLGLDRRIVYIAPSCEKITGYRADEFMADPELLVSVVHPEDREMYRSHGDRACGLMIEQDALEFRIVRRDGQMRWMHHDCRPIFDEKGTYLGRRVTCADCSARKEAEMFLNQANSRLSSTVNELWQHDRELTLLNEMNQKLQSCRTEIEALKVAGYHVEQLFPELCGGLATRHGSIFDTVVHWGHGECAHNLRDRYAIDDCWALRSGQNFHGTASTQVGCTHFEVAEVGGYLCVPLSVDGEVIGVLHLQAVDHGELDQRIVQIANGAGEVIKLAMANLRLREALREQATRDVLTSLFNRRYLEENLAREIQRTERSGQPLSVVMLDIDHFKSFNDTFGHNAGDLVLQRIGEVLMNSVRKIDIPCRFGGEELLIIFPDTPLEQAGRKVEQLLEQVRKLEIRFGDLLLPMVTMSGGLAVAPTHGMTADNIIRAADQALYEAKHAGRDRLCVAAQNT